jgi:hypothetical protein
MSDRYLPLDARIVGPRLCREFFVDAKPKSQSDRVSLDSQSHKAAY